MAFGVENGAVRSLQCGGNCLGDRTPQLIEYARWTQQSACLMPQWCVDQMVAGARLDTYIRVAFVRPPPGEARFNEIAALKKFDRSK